MSWDETINSPREGSTEDWMLQELLAVREILETWNFQPEYAYARLDRVIAWLRMGEEDV